MIKHGWRIDGHEHWIRVDKDTWIGAPFHIHVDGRVRKLVGTSIGHRQWVAEFMVGSHHAALTKWIQYPGWPQRLRRVFTLANLRDPMSSVRYRKVYSLTVDGHALGSWLLTVRGHTAAWTFDENSVGPWTSAQSW